MRKLIALLLLMGCLMTMLIPGVAAQEQAFRDLDDITNRTQVLFLLDLGLISGYDDQTFRPEATITRAETAKIVALLYGDDPQPQDGDPTFSDTTGHWAESYIRFLAGKAVVSGNGAGAFRPGAAVTARELAKMLLVAVGADGSRYTGSGWAQRVDADADEAGIYTRFTQDPARPVSRDDACLLIYNAMQGLAIDGYNDDGSVRYSVDALLNPISFLEARFGVRRYTGMIEANQCVDLANPGKTLEAGYTKLEGHTAFAVETDLSMVGQYVDIYVRDGQVLGAPCASTQAVSYTLDSVQTLVELCKSSDYHVDDDAAVYLNYVPVEGGLSALPTAASVTVLDRDGDLGLETILALETTACTVTGTNPLTIQVGGATVEARSMRTGQGYVAGQSARCVQVAGTWYVN